MSDVIPGHQTLTPALAVMLVTPPLLLWRASSTSGLRETGTHPHYLLLNSEGLLHLLLSRLTV